MVTRTYGYKSLVDHILLALLRTPYPQVPLPPPLGKPSVCSILLLASVPAHLLLLVATVRELLSSATPLLASALLFRTRSKACKSTLFEVVLEWEVDAIQCAVWIHKEPPEPRCHPWVSFFQDQSFLFINRLGLLWNSDCWLFAFPLCW
jgi:hypothetical protein